MKKLLWIFLCLLISGYIFAQNDTSHRAGGEVYSEKSCGQDF